MWFVAELRRRNVHRAAVFHAASAWLPVIGLPAPGEKAQAVSRIAAADSRSATALASERKP